MDGIFFAANDPVAISPVLRKALKAGIHVIGYDAESEPDAREWQSIIDDEQSDDERNAAQQDAVSGLGA